MPKEIAIRIERLRVGKPMHSWRRIAEIIHEEYLWYISWNFDDPDEIKGHQWLGQDLCKKAASTLKIPKEIYDEHWEQRINLIGWTAGLR